MEVSVAAVMGAAGGNAAAVAPFALASDPAACSGAVDPPAPLPADGLGDDASGGGAGKVDICAFKPKDEEATRNKMRRGFMLG
jgi:hypothetical protein